MNCRTESENREGRMSQAQILFGKDEKGLSEHSGNQSSLKHTVNGSPILITGTLAIQHLKFSTYCLLKVGF